MPYCVNCGSFLHDDGYFCASCGKRVVDAPREDSSVDRAIEAAEAACEGGAACEAEATSLSKAPQEPASVRKLVYEGKLYKCPNCGEMLKSFAFACPTCGYETRGADAVSSVRELAAKLEFVDAKEMMVSREFDSLEMPLLGLKLKKAKELEVEELREEFERQREQEKASLITGYVIPNSKEDVMEFILFASSNVDPGHADGLIAKAWLSKLDQACRKAELFMGDDPDIARVKAVYERKLEEIAREKRKSLLVIFGPLGLVMLLSLFCLGMESDPSLTLTVSVCTLLLLGLFLLEKKTGFVVGFIRGRR